MRKFAHIIVLTFILSSCNGWGIQPVPGPTPFLPSTPTPSILSPTPIVIGVNTSTPIVATGTPSPTNTNIPAFTHTPTITISPTATFTSSPAGPAISITVLGCNTSVDVVHSLGEVTNAFVTLKNTGGVELTDIRATLFALDEGREHPDKTIELVALPVGNQVTIKLTVDSTYRKETPIQVEVVSGQGTFPREGLASCKEIGILAPNPDSLNTPAPIVP